MAERRWRGRQVRTGITGGSQRNIRDATLEGLSAVQRKLRRNSPSGEVYRVPGTQRLYRASAPGEPPANRTGGYANSFQPQYRQNEGIIGTKDKRGPALEFGTRRMAARPHVRPALSEASRRLKSILARRVL